MICFKAIDELVPMPASPQVVATNELIVESNANLSALLARASGDVGLVHELVEIFLEDWGRNFFRMFARPSKAKTPVLWNAPHIRQKARSPVSQMARLYTPLSGCSRWSGRRLARGA